ncbi:MAG: hypothetical protein Q9175_006027 [Cornicularia normoerica]
MPFQYKKVLVIGATSGIGKALASRLVQEGSSVIVVGRRKENLEAFVHEHGKEKSSAVPFDITELDKIPNFVTNITKTHTDLDCVILNSGIQRGFDFSKPETVDMDLLHDEKHQPDIKNGRQMGMPLDQFTNEAYEGLAAGKEDVAVEKSRDWYYKFEPARRELFNGLVKAMKQR